MRCGTRLRASFRLDYEAQGFALSWHSGYLRERRWIQTALMGEFDRAAVAPMADALSRELSLAGVVSGA